MRTECKWSVDEFITRGRTRTPVAVVAARRHLSCNGNGLSFLWSEAILNSARFSLAIADDVTRHTELRRERRVAVASRRGEGLFEWRGTLSSSDPPSYEKAEGCGY